MKLYALPLVTSQLRISWVTKCCLWLSKKITYHLVNYLIPALLCHPSVIGSWSAKQSEGRPLISIQHVSLARQQEHLNFWHCLWEYPGVALSLRGDNVEFLPAQLLVSTTKTCILSAPYLSNHPFSSSRLPSKSALLSQLLPDFPWLPQRVIIVIPSSVLGTL